MEKIYRYIILAATALAVASCANDIEDTTATTGSSNLKFIVGDFPAFEDSQTRTIGTPDKGKTSWEDGDELLIQLTNSTYTGQYYTLVKTSSGWDISDSQTLQYKEGENPSITAFYAPGYTWKNGNVELTNPNDTGKDEYIKVNCSLTGDNKDVVKIPFKFATRTYSRLRIATIPNTTITVETASFRPSGQTSTGNSTYSLTSDANGNAYLYGKFTDSGRVTVKYDGSAIASHEFTTETTDGRSYALDATFVSIVGMSAENIQNEIKKKLNAGRTEINLILDSDAGTDIFNAIREALKGCADGSISLSLLGCTEIPADGLSEISALKSIYLPDVTKLGKSALANCKKMKTVNAPKVTTIDEKAFYGCKALGKVILRALTDVRGEANSENGIFDGINYSSPYIDLYLHERQKDMIGELDTSSSQYIWKPSYEDYFDTLYSYECYFLGYHFKGIWAWK